MTAYDKARAFILRNARPLDLAIFRYYFENGLREDVTEALAAYQNPDGGFGHGLEADNFNPDSLPMGAWKATEYICKIGGLEAEHPVIQGILRYLDSGKDFDVIHNQWLNVVPSSNDYPCAVWWKYPEEGSRFEYNPTAALAGFTVKYAEPGSALHQKGVRIVREAADWFIQDAPVERHVANCFIAMYDYCTEAGAMPFDGAALLAKLDEIVDRSVCRDISQWGAYMPRPSSFLTSRESRFYHEGLEELCRAECEYIKDTQLPDGSFPVPWSWCNEHKEWQIAENWCKAIIAIDNMLFLSRFDAGENAEQ